MGCSNYNCAPLTDYDSTIANCGSKTRLSGASFMGLVECGSSLSNPSSATLINAMIAAETMTIVGNIRLGFGDPSAITQDPVTSCGSSVTVNYNRTAVVKDYKVTKGNTLFWNSAKRRSFAQLLIWECTTDGLADLVSFVDAEIIVDSKRNFADSNDQAQYYDITISWKSLDDPLQYDAPVGVTGVDA